jgi:integrase/recombinase XerD
VVRYRSFLESLSLLPSPSWATRFARVSAVVGLTLGDYRLEGKRGRLRLMEKGNKEKLDWLHREAEEFLDAYLAPAGIEDPKAPLFQTLDKAHILSGEVLSRRDMLRAAKQRCNAAGLSESFCNHMFRVTGITVFLNNGGSLEKRANHSDPRTTKFYDRRKPERD